MKRGIIFIFLVTVLLLPAIAPARASDTSGETLVLRGKLSFDRAGEAEVPVLKGYVLESQADMSQLGFYYVEAKIKPLKKLHSLGLPVAKVLDVNILDKGEKRIILEGLVTRENLEGGFYSLQGYRLVGDYDFASLEGRMARAGGLPDYSPSIYMTRAIEVFELEKIDPRGPQQLDGVIKRQLMPGGSGIFYSLAGYTLIGPYQFREYEGASVRVRGSASPGPAIGGRPVFNVAEIETISVPPVEDSIKPGVKLDRKNPGAEPAIFLSKPERQIIIVFLGETIKPGREPVLIAGRLLMAVEDLHQFGLKYQLSKDGTIYIESERTGRNLKLTEGFFTVSTPGGISKIDAAPVRWEDTTWIPLRAVLENLGYRVGWDETVPMVRVEQ